MVINLQKMTPRPHEQPNNRTEQVQEEIPHRIPSIITCRVV